MSHIEDMLLKATKSPNKNTREVAKLMIESKKDEGPALKALNARMQQSPPPSKAEMATLWAAVEAESANTPVDVVVNALNALMAALPPKKRPALSPAEWSPLYRVMREALEAYAAKRAKA